MPCSNNKYIVAYKANPMKQCYVTNISRAIVIFISFALLFSLKVYSQEKEIQVSDSTKVVNKALYISDISEETEKLSQRITKLKEILLPSTNILQVDSLLNVSKLEVNKKRDTLLVQLDKINQRSLRVIEIEWANYATRVKNYQKTLKDRTEVISEINDDLVIELEKWEQTKEKLKSASASKEVLSSLELVIKAIQEIIIVANDRLEYIFTIQKRLTDLVLIIDDATSEIELVEQKLHKDYFIFDNQPIWKITNNVTEPEGISKGSTISTFQLIMNGLQENKNQLVEFLSLHIKLFIFQLLFIIILFVFIISVKNRWINDIKELINPIEIQAEIILSNPISTTLVVGVLFSAFFYEALLPIFGDLHSLIVLLGTAYLLPKLTHKKFGVFLNLIFLVYLIHTLEAYLTPQVSLVRWLILVDGIILIIAIVLGRKIVLKSSENFQQIFKIFKILSQIYILFLTVAIIANIIGMVSLSGFIIRGVLISTGLGMVVYLAVKVTASIVILIFKLRKSYSLQTFTNIVNATHKRIQPILNWIGLLVWLMFTFKGFEFNDYIVDWFNRLMLHSWDIGEMTISFGGLLSFMGIFIFALLLAKLAAAIFQDEWMVNILPRGVAPAVSLLLRIILITIGLYIALLSAGIDLSKLGFMLGALGVGIGFGLQNVVLNFVAGLILAFERPINLGDTIEVDQEFGVVTNIGIRSSNIKSYAGYEAIIPNGDLISKKVINYTLSNRDRRSKILMKTAPSADPEKVIALFNKIATDHVNTKEDPAPKTYFYGYDQDGNLSFALLYWTTFSDTLKTDHEIALKTFTKLKEVGIQAPAPIRRIVNDK